MHDSNYYWWWPSWHWVCTGVVKVTPAHDPDDFETGLRHKLPFTSIFTPDNKINDICPDFSGMHRFCVRIAISDALKELGLFDHEEDHEMRLGITQRGHDIVEQVIKEQLFVDTKSMAVRALEVVRNGELELVPKPTGKDGMRISGHCAFHANSGMDIAFQLTKSLLTVFSMNGLLLMIMMRQFKLSKENMIMSRIKSSKTRMFWTHGSAWHFFHSLDWMKMIWRDITHGMFWRLSGTSWHSGFQKWSWWDLKVEFPHGIPQCWDDSLRLTLCTFTGLGGTANLNMNVVVSYRNFCNKI